MALLPRDREVIIIIIGGYDFAAPIVRNGRHIAHHTQGFANPFKKITLSLGKLCGRRPTPCLAMSDEEEYEYGSDAEYAYSDEDDENNEGSDELIEIENAFYEGDDCRMEDPVRACEMFETVVALECSRGDEVKWRFKALEHLVVLQQRLGNLDTMADKYREMLRWAPAVTRNECNDSVNAVLEAISDESAKLPPDVLSQMYEITFEALKAANNERLWFNTNIKVGKIYLQQRAYDKVASVVKELRASCQTRDGVDDPSKSTSLLEAYALEIQLCAATGDSARLKAIYPHTLNLNAAVADPRIMGVIREEGGKMYMRDGDWLAAYNEFYEGFRAYQEAGNLRAKDCLKYVLIANMLALSDINPFDAREAKAYQEEREITAMKRLRLAYDANDLAAFEATLKDKHARILDDPFIMSFVEPLRTKMREQVLLNLVKPYRRCKLQYLANELGLDLEHLHDLLVDMILDDRINGKIDQINNHLILTEAAYDINNSPLNAVEAGFTKRFEALANWANALDTLSASLAARVQ